MCFSSVCSRSSVLLLLLLLGAGVSKGLNEELGEWLQGLGAEVPVSKPLHPKGATCMYLSGEPPSRAYPNPADITWQRLVGDDGKPARLWVGGATSTDPKQGQLGDCWLISALSLVATRDGAHRWGVCVDLALY